jgi:hypothetical protein
MKTLHSAVYVFLLVCGGAFAAPVAKAPLFGELAVLLAKGYFGDYVRPDASMAECAAFLNSQGICFSLFSLVDPAATVTKEDLARAVGQSTRLFSGEAEIVNGCIKKPLEAESWVDYCLLNDIDLVPVWDWFARRTGAETISEVEAFYKK